MDPAARTDLRARSERRMVRWVLGQLGTGTAQLVMPKTTRTPRCWVRGSPTAWCGGLAPGKQFDVKTVVLVKSRLVGLANGDTGSLLGGEVQRFADGRCAGRGSGAAHCRRGHQHGRPAVGGTVACCVGLARPSPNRAGTSRNTTTRLADARSRQSSSADSLDKLPCRDAPRPRSIR